MLKTVFLFGMLASMPTSNHAYCGTSFEGAPISIISKAGHSGFERGISIQASICGHVLTVVFSKDIGQVDVGIVSLTGGSTESFAERTPNGFNLYLPEEGDYLITFTLANGDEYYGEFTVTD